MERYIPFNKLLFKFSENKLTFICLIRCCLPVQFPYNKILLESEPLCSEQHGQQVSSSKSTFNYLNIYMGLYFSMCNIYYRYANPNFYVMDMDDEDDSLEVPAIKIKKLRDLNEIFIQVKY